MTAIPSQTLPRPATDATVTAGLPEAGLSARLDPSTAITQGVVGGRKFGGRVMNWILGGFGDWLAYLREADGISLTDTAQVLELSISAASIINGGFELKGAVDISPLEPAAEQQTVSTQLVWNLSALLPRNALLTRMTIDVQAEAGYSINPSSSEFPTLGLYSRSWSDNAIHHLTTDVVDAPADVAAYKTRHELTFDFSGSPVDLRNVASGGTFRSLYMVLTGALGASFAQGNVLFMAPRAYVKSKPWA
jgi:hypothetical protein